MEADLNPHFCHILYVKTLIVNLIQNYILYIYITGVYILLSLKEPLANGDTRLKSQSYQRFEPQLQTKNQGAQS